MRLGFSGKMFAAAKADFEPESAGAWETSRRVAERLRRIERQARQKRLEEVVLDGR